MSSHNSNPSIDRRSKLERHRRIAKRILISFLILAALNLPFVLLILVPFVELFGSTLVALIIFMVALLVLPVLFAWWRIRAIDAELRGPVSTPSSEPLDEEEKSLARTRVYFVLAKNIMMAISAAFYGAGVVLLNTIVTDGSSLPLILLGVGAVTTFAALYLLRKTKQYDTAFMSKVLGDIEKLKLPALTESGSE